jgi:type VI protein secretion system component VasA
VRPALVGERDAQLVLRILNGESAAIHKLYEFLFLNAQRVSLHSKDGAAKAILPAGSLRQVGFTTTEGILPYSERSFLGYRLLQEYFSFHEKFFFFDLTGLDRFAKSDFGSKFEILISLKEPEQRMSGRSGAKCGPTPSARLYAHREFIQAHCGAHSAFANQNQYRIIQISTVEQAPKSTPSIMSLNSILPDNAQL